MIHKSPIELLAVRGAQWLVEVNARDLGAHYFTQWRNLHCLPPVNIALNPF